MAGRASIRKLLIVGWDGAEPTIVAGMLKDGRLPKLASLSEAGFMTSVSSTIPPSSLPAWTSAMTGVNPGRHGLVDFVRLDPGRHSLRLVNASEREVPTLFELAGRLGLSVACLGMPGSWPPSPDAGVCIAGFDSPVATTAARSAFQPPELFDELKARELVWPYGRTDELAVGTGWHSRTRRILTTTIECKTRIAETILREKTFDLFAIVFSESDTAGHHFWAHHDVHSPRRRALGLDAKRHGDTIEKTYAALDRALGRLLAACGPQTAVLVISDHGFGGSSDQVVFINRWLASEGLLRFSSLDGIASNIASALTASAARILPAAVKEALLRGPLQRAVLQFEGLGRFGAIDWKATRAFSDELPQNPGIWINDPLVRNGAKGSISEQRLRLVDRVTDRLLAWRDQLGRPVVRRVHRTGEVNPGPYANRAPDLLLELAEWDGYNLVAAPSRGRPGKLLGTLDANQLIGSKGSGTSGSHRSYGMLVAAGPGVGSSAPAGGARLVDICPSALALLDLPLPAGLDGRCLQEIASANIIKPAEASPATITTNSAYTKEQERLVRKRLGNLGYL